MSTEHNHYSNQDNVTILELLGKETLERIQDAFHNVTGMGLVVVDYRGEPLTKMTGFTPFCQYIRGHYNGDHLCNMSDAFGSTQSAVMRHYCIYKCPRGMMEIAIPIIVDDQYLGGFLAGQVRCNCVPEDVASFAGAVRNGKETEIIDRDEQAKALYDDVQEYNYQSFVNVAELIYIVVTLLCEKEMATRKSYRREMQSLEEQLEKERQKSQHLKDDLQNLRFHFSPLFMMHTLSSISNLAILEGADRTQAMASDLSDYLKKTLYLKANDVRISEEFEILESFLRIWQSKYPEKLTYTLEMKNKMDLQRVPVNITLPFISNALLSLATPGLSSMHIELFAFHEDSRLHLQIRKTTKTDPLSVASTEADYVTEIDNDETREETGVQLALAKDRLQTLFGDRCSITERTESEETHLTDISFPMYYRE